MVRDALMPRLVRAIPLYPIQVRLSALAYRKRWMPTGDARTVLRSGMAADLRLDEWPQALAFLTGRYDPALVQTIVAALPRDGVFVDGGAHVGLVSLQVARSRPEATVIGYDPHPDAAVGFKRHLALNPSPRISFHEKALGGEIGTARVDADHRVNQSDGDIVPVVRLDDELNAQGISRVDVLKLDVQGFELEALRGASEALSEQRIRTIIYEVDPVLLDLAGASEDELTRYLGGFGYREASVRASVFRGRLGDRIFMARREKPNI
jgi:FkbM family methyltransferase